MIGSPGVNLHAPGPIGDTTPSTLAGTTLNLTGTSTALLQINYDSTHRNYIYSLANGTLIIDQIDRQDLIINNNGVSVFRIQGTSVDLTQEFGYYTVGTNHAAANRPKFCVYSAPGLSGAGIGCPAVQQVSLVANDTDVLIGSTTAIKVVSGVQFWVGNAAVTGLSAGVLAGQTNASIVLYDSGGQAYRIPCII